MAGLNANRQAPGDRLVRAFLVPALLILIALAAWRGIGPALASAPSLPVASAADARLTGLLERLAGSGQVEAMMVPGDEEGAGVLVLLDERAGEAIADHEISSLILATGLIDSTAAARIEIRRIAFASMPGARFSAAIEFCGFVLIAACLVGALAAAQQNAAGPVETPRPRERAQAQETSPRMDEGRALALQAIRTDPARAASVLRAWIAAEGGRA